MTSLSKLRLLVVDDNDYARTLAAGLLKKLGVTECVQAQSGAEAVSLLAKERFDVLLTDWYMPDINGAGLVKIVRDDRFETNRGLPVIVMTAYASTENLTRAKSLGVTNILIKPLDPKLLGSILAKLAAERTVRFDEAYADGEFLSIWTPAH